MDVGTAVNPDGVRAQIEGSAMWGVSIALFEQAHVKDGGALQVANFDTYTPLRMSRMPELDIRIIANGEAPSGCGEPAVTVMAPAMANAIFKAAGARVRSLPITAEAQPYYANPRDWHCMNLTVATCQRPTRTVTLSTMLSRLR